MMKRLITFLAAALAIAAVGAGEVASAHRNATRHHTAATHRSGAHRQTAKRAAVDEPTEAESGESNEESTGDGPGGHEDEPGAEVDHQFEGEE